MTNGTWKAARRKYGVAVCSYNSASVLQSLPLQVGETVQIWEEYWPDDTTVTWLRGCHFSNKNKKGIFPASYVATKDCTVENEGPFEVVTPVEDAIIKELTFVLREWHVRWKTLYVDRKALFQTILLVMEQLAKFRSNLVSNTLTKEHAEELKHQVVTMIDWGNGQLGMDLVPRVAYQQAEPDNISVVEMFRIHEQSVKNCQGAWLPSDLSEQENSPSALPSITQVTFAPNLRRKESMVAPGLAQCPLPNQCGGRKSSIIADRAGEKVSSLADFILSRLTTFQDRNLEEPSGMGVKVKGRENRGEAIHHLLVGLNNFGCSVGDSAEVLVSLYDSTEGKFLSEKFVMNFGKDGQRLGADKNSTIFTDLSSDDMQKEIYLVLQIFRKGRLTHEGSFKKVPHYHYRRPWGISVLCLKDLFQINPENELEYSLRVQTVDNESFYNMHEVQIKKQMQMIGKSFASDKQNQNVALSVKVLHGDMKSVKIENPILFSKGVVLTQRMGFPDYVNPGEIRNDLYLTLQMAEFDRGSKTASKNVEVRVTVFNDKYDVIQDCILAANGDSMTSNFFSYVLYHNNSPKWNETIRLSIPIEKFSTAHIRLELCHCSNRDKTEKKMYGFAYLSVVDKGNATRLDGKYDLCIYKCEDISKIKDYLRLPSLRDDFNDPAIMPSIPDNIPYPHSNKEYITVETFLCSSKFAQKAELFNILQWASMNPAKAPQHLERLMYVRGQEVVRYLQDILDALFNMFNPREGQRVPYDIHIFQALVHIFNLLHEEMFEKFSVVLEDYLEKSFSSPVAHRDLMHCLLVHAERVYTCTDFDDKSTRKVFKVLEDIFKFSVKSCLLSQRLYGDKFILEFQNSLNEVFKAFGKIVHSQEKVLSKAQAQLLTHLHKAYIPLLHIIPTHTLSQLVAYILNQVNRDAGTTVSKAKTVLIKNTIGSALMRDTQSRTKLLPLFLGHLKKSLINKKHLDVTANTLGDLLTMIYQLKETVSIKEEVTKIVQGIFDVTVRLLWALNDEEKEAQCRGLLVSCLTEVLRLMDDGHYEKLMGDYPKPKPLKDFLNRVLMVFRALVGNEVFPSDWITMTMVMNNVMLTSIQYIADDLTVSFLDGNAFDSDLWSNFFLMAVDFITQPPLQLEKYSEAKTSQIKDKYNDMRIPVGFHIYSLWNQLGSNKQHLMMDMIGPFLKATMTREVEVRKATIPIFFDIMSCEFQLNQHLRRVEGKMIHELDSLVIEHNGDKDYKQLFKTILLDKVQAEPELQEEGKRFVFSVTDLLERLLDYREIMDREEQRDTKMHCTFNILNFYKDSRRDMYIRYISRLYELHYSASNFVEAGLTLRLYAQLLNWSQTRLPEEMSYPSQTEAERKEELFNRIINCFDKGKAWEYGIPLCKELGEHYESTFQYMKLGQTLQKQATFLYQILEGPKLRQNPTYYRVAYYGNTFPPYLKNKAFVYRGDECLKLATIMNQLMTEYPSANILTTNSPPDESYKFGDSQYIQIISVKPVPVERPEFAGKEVPIEISSFYSTNEVDTFQFDRPYHRGEKDPNNEFKTLCFERTVLKSAYKLPGILRWYEVTSSTVVHLSPVEAAIDTVRQMIAELKSSADQAHCNPEQWIRHLEMRLQGVISGAVNGGILKYKEAFFNDSYTSKYPAEAIFIDELKSLISDQIQLLDRGLVLHGKYASQEMQPLHRSLYDTLSGLKQSLGYQSLPSASKHRGSAVSIGSMNARPGTPSSTSLNSSGSNRSSVISGNDGNYIEDDSVYVEPPDIVVPDVRRRLQSQTYKTNAPGTETHYHPYPPPCPEKRRCSSLRVASLTNLAQKSGSQRPLSAIVTSTNPLQYPLPDPSISMTNLPTGEDLKNHTPPSLPPRIASSLDLFSGVPKTHSPNQPPPIPDRKQTNRNSSVPWSELDRQPQPTVARSESTKSIESRNIIQETAPPPPPRSTMISPTTPTPRTGALASAAPPLPGKRLTTAQMHPFGNSVNGAGAGYNNFSQGNAQIANNNNNNTSACNLNQQPGLTSPLSAKNPPSVIVRSPSNKSEPSPVPTPSPTANNPLQPQMITSPVSAKDPPPVLARSPFLNKSGPPPIPTQSPSAKDPPQIQPRPTAASVAPRSPSSNPVLSPSGDAPQTSPSGGPPQLAPKPSVMSAVTPPSNLRATIPLRTTPQDGQGAPPPIPLRKPSLTQQNS